MKLYDPRCHELAEHFLSDDDVTPAENELRLQSLAAAIQAAVEDWMDDEDARLAKEKDAGDHAGRREEP